MGCEVLLPCSSGISDGDNTGGARAGEVGLVEAHNEGSRSRLELLESFEAGPVIVVVDATETPEHGYGEDVAVVRVVWVGSPIVVPTERAGSPFERVAACDTCFAERRGEASDRDAGRGRGRRRGRG